MHMRQTLEFGSGGCARRHDDDDSDADLCIIRGARGWRTGCGVWGERGAWLCRCALYGYFLFMSARIMAFTIMFSSRINW